MSTYLYFITLANLSALLWVMLLVFSIFAVVTNYYISQFSQNSAEGTRSEQKGAIYKLIVSLSMGAKFYNQNEYTELTFAAQCWLGTITVLIWGIALIFIKK